MGKTILVSSHILPELADICNKIGIIERGRLLFDGDVQSAIKQVRTRIIMHISVGNGMHQSAADRLSAHPHIAEVEMEEDDVIKVTLIGEIDDSTFIADFLVQNGFKIKMIKEEDIDLEDVFMNITKGITN